MNADEIRSAMDAIAVPTKQAIPQSAGPVKWMVDRQSAAIAAAELIERAMAAEQALHADELVELADRLSEMARQDRDILNTSAERYKNERDAERAHTQAVIDAIRQLHIGGMPYGGMALCRGCHQPWPCETLDALAGDPLPTPPPAECPTCDGNGCEEGCGLSAGCMYVNAGPDSHKVCPSCHGSGLAGEPQP